SVASEVVWWSDDQAASTAVGNSEVYSMLMYIDPQAYQPQMGDPTLSMDQIIALQNTSSWAFDPFTGERGTNYLAPKDAADVKWFLGPYNNPQMFYDSPYVHTVVLRDLKPGKEYGYRVAGDPRNHTFVMPLEPHTQGRAELATSLYPFMFAVTADMGQTAVSLANVRLLQAMLEAAEPGRGVLLQGGDLSYADGFHPRWDSYGRMIEPLASRFTQASQPASLFILKLMLSILSYTRDAQPFQAECFRVETDSPMAIAHNCWQPRIPLRRGMGCLQR
ncbi:MAG: hypothetical protein SGPRY_004163, partial [Prymnesium sp.]